MQLPGLEQLKFLVETDRLPSGIAVHEVMEILAANPHLLSAHDVVDLLRDNAHNTLFSKWGSEWHVTLEEAEMLLERMQSLPPNKL